MCGMQGERHFLKEGQKDLTQLPLIFNKFYNNFRIIIILLLDP